MQVCPHVRPDPFRAGVGQIRGQVARQAPGDRQGEHAQRRGGGEPEGVVRDRRQPVRPGLGERPAADGVVDGEQQRPGPGEVEELKLTVPGSALLVRLIVALPICLLLTPAL